jgi:glycosyltransferase involved in cell wall biosynthesis
VPARLIALVPSGVDPRRFLGGDGAKARADLGVPQRAPLAGTLAHFGWHKSLETLIAAAEHVVATVPEAWIAIVGEGELRASLESERAKSPVRERVLLPGFRANVADFLAAFDLFVMPSVMEGLCTAILDAFAAGVPVVASRAGGIPELVEHEATGLLVEPRRPRELAAAIARALHDEPLRRRLIEGGRARLHERFTEDAMVEGTLAVYRELLADRALALA